MAMDPPIDARIGVVEVRFGGDRRDASDSVASNAVFEVRRRLQNFTSGDIDGLHGGDQIES